MNGYLLIDKPEGWTSFDVVAKARGIVRQATGQKIKIGHAGTLDPFATGLLIVLLGSYTKQQDAFMKKYKTYEVTIELGKTSSTGDPEGDTTTVTDRKPPSSEVNDVLKRFIGTIEQTPPVHSAIKINGKRAYELARAGKPVEMKTRQVTIYSIDNAIYAYPAVTFRCRVSSGTYIRSLASDIGQELGTGAYVTMLRRTEINTFSVHDAISAENLSEESIKTHLLA
jgi:tRNA pseudouridine55 synthase